MVSNELIVAGTVITAIGLAPIVLGFGTVGVGAATTAAAIQSSIGSVAAGSWFATMTSLAGTGSVALGVAPKIKNLFRKKEESQ